MNEYFKLFEDIDRAINKRFSAPLLPFRIIGRAALELAGLSSRGTKDVDALEEALKVGTLSDKGTSEIEGFLKSEFGKGSPGDRRHGLYLDLVGKGVAWLPGKPRFIDVNSYGSIEISRLHPADVCVSKTFSNFKRERGRGSDRTDIIEALEGSLFEAAEYVNRLDESFSLYEMHAEAPDIFPRILKFIKGEIIPKYCEGNLGLRYAIPSWMENI